MQCGLDLRHGGVWAGRIEGYLRGKRLPRVTLRGSNRSVAGRLHRPYCLGISADHLGTTTQIGSLSMNSTALVISDDLILRSQARALLGQAQVACTCSGVVPFKRTVESAKFDAIVLDVGSRADTVSALEYVRTGKLNRYSIVLAVVEDGASASAAWSAGANFTIRRSADLREDLKKAFTSAHGLILRENRRYQRHTVDLPVEVIANGRSLWARMLDISERGACLECTFPIATQPIQLRFSLPGLSQHLMLDGFAAWVRDGKAGIQFTSLAESSHAALCKWLATRMCIPSAQI